MSLTDEQRKIIVDLEYERALSIFAQIDALRQLSFWDNVANRLYYSIFHAVTALLIHDGHFAGTHKGAVQTFGQHYVVAGTFSIEEGKLYSQLQTLREKSDYNCHFTAGSVDVEPMIEPVGKMIRHIGEYIGYESPNK